MKDSIAVIIPCYNGWKYMSNCLESLENQSSLPNQIIIVDDCSTDDSFEHLNNYILKSPLKIQLVRNESNVGPGQSRANALKYVATEYVSFCDCDDWFEVTFI